MAKQTGNASKISFGKKKEGYDYFLLSSYPSNLRLFYDFTKFIPANVYLLMNKYQSVLFSFEILV
jgi:hypothetical protein